MAAAAAAVGLGQFSGVALASDAPSTLVRSYTAPNGETYLSVSLRAENLPAEPVPHDHVVLVDTSASQVGEHRRHALAVVDQFLAALPASDRVSVVAIDVGSAPMTKGFVTPSQAAAEAVSGLKKRVPAGATNLQAALTSALQQFDRTRPGSIVVIGDGMSIAHLLQPAELNSLTSAMKDARVAVHSYAVGSKTDMQLLGILATQTGGVVKIDNGQTTPDVVGRELATAATLPVFYPEALQVNWTGAEVQPSQALPMRADRSTVYLARGRVAPDATLTVSGGQSKYSWSVSQPQMTQGTTVLGHLWHSTNELGGDLLPLAGDELVAYAQDMQVARVESLEAQGTAAMKAGRKEVAQNIGRTLNSIEPGNVRAVVFQQAGEQDPAPLPSPPPAAADDLSPRELPSGRGLIADVEARRAALAGRLQRELEVAIQAARSEVTLDPAAAQARLEAELASLKAATEIDREAQDRLIRTANGALQDIKARRATLETAQASRQRAAAERRAAQQLENRLAADERNLKNLVDQVRAAMNDGFHGDSAAFEEAEAIGRIIYSRNPGSAMGTATVFEPEAAGALDKSSRLRALRSDKFLAMLHQVELSHVPFPDEPPINYPPAEVWQYITQLRQKWKSVDLHKNSPNEERIYKALDQTVDFQFTGQTLQEVINYLSTEHNITIRLDNTELTNAGVGPDQEIQLVISGITLRAALKLMLEDVGGTELAYIIEDEVMKITTREKADTIQQVRVYPVADLAISPIVQPMIAQSIAGSAGGGQGGLGGIGGGGGMGGGMGGMGGGGMGGMGGGGMGGMGGGGGGFFSVPNPEAAPLKKKQ
ncbi:hypothetical protein Pan44_11630 [Caulifigura coniformis]|uniref:VWFA domain-containing protein n=2 Tax=Caulifigura coniformis TaxID=2527983 RepID=A0A517SAJ8_9PLAN|nr:hypothetical protein Pan44_11630 [Caulifigura coniformis]